MNGPATPWPALRALHTKMAALPVDEHLFQILGMLPEVSPQVIASACDPASPVLMDWSIYRAIAAACTGGEHGADRIRPAYLDAEATRPDGQVPAEPAPIGRPLGAALEEQRAALAAASLADQPTIPRLKLPLPLVKTAMEGALNLENVSSKSDFARFLKSLVVQSGLTLRVIQENTRALNAGAECCRSTLSDALRHGKIPTSGPVMTTLLMVLFAAIDEVEPDTDRVQHATRNAMRVWRSLQRPPAGAPVLAAGAPEPALRRALGALAQAEQAAARAGSRDAPGLAHAQRILRDLLAG